MFGNEEIIDGEKILKMLIEKTVENVKNKYCEISDNLIGVNEYIMKLGIPRREEFENEKSYKIFINKFVRMLKHCS
jgi:hypothetical protein